ncbi:MAG: alpha/beta fold hydrolase [Methyloligellaceae bacterium]
MLRTFLACLLSMIVLAAPAAAARQAKTVELKIGGHVALGDLVIPEGASLAGGVLLITHGTLAHKDMELVEALQTALAERGVATLAHSLTLSLDRRTGMYDCARPHRHRHEDAVEEIAAWVSWLKQQGAAKVALLGHSRGGNQAAWFAAERDSVDRVILLAPATGQSPARAAASYRQRFKADLAPILDAAAAKVKAGLGDELLDVPGFIYCPAGKASAKSILSYYGDEPRRATEHLAPAIKVPVLVIAGSRDTTVPDVVEKFEPLARPGRLRLEVIEDAGHMFLDFYAEDAADLIAAFLEENQ